METGPARASGRGFFMPGDRALHRAATAKATVNAPLHDAPSHSASAYRLLSILSRCRPQPVPQRFLLKIAAFSATRSCLPSA